MVYKDPERRKAYQREWARKYRSTPEGKQRQKINSKKSRQRHPEAVKLRKKRNYSKYREYFRKYYRIHYKKTRDELITHYSNGNNSCNCCGESNASFLTIDHINGNGTQERKRIGASQLIYHLKKSGFPDGYQILCYNCNCGRQKHDGICPHKLI